MEMVEVVIRIPKDLYEGIECRDGSLETEYVCDELMKAVDNGTVLPKGHGDLKDKMDMCCKDCTVCEYTHVCNIYSAPTIIKATMEVEK